MLSLLFQYWPPYGAATVRTSPFLGRQWLAEKWRLRGGSGALTLLLGNHLATMGVHIKYIYGVHIWSTYRYIAIVVAPRDPRHWLRGSVRNWVQIYARWRLQANQQPKHQQFWAFGGPMA